MLRVPRIEFPDYPSNECLRTVSKDKFMAAFYERPSDWGKHQFTPCRPFAKGPRFMNMVMTFVLHPFSHYNSIIEPRARFLLSFLEHLTIDFPSHFITSVQGTRIVVTPQIVADVLYVPRVEFLDYPGCDRLRTVSKDELIFAFCECPSDWGEC